MLNASAGSGKTYRLVLQYLTLLFEAPGSGKYRHLVAMTFTNKAAFEMKERILQALHDISTYKEGDERTLTLIKTLSEMLGQPVTMFPDRAKQFFLKFFMDMKIFLFQRLINSTFV